MLLKRNFIKNVMCAIIVTNTLFFSNAMASDGKLPSNTYDRNNKNLNFSNNYVSRNEKWLINDSMRLPISNFGAAILNNKIYIVGGLNSNGTSSEVKAYDLESKQWIKCADMKYDRSNLGVVSLNGKLYAIGGEHVTRSKDEHLQFSEIASASVAVADDGDDGDDLSPIWDLNVVEEYDPETDKWTEKADMIMAIKDFGIASFNDKIYLCGGSQFLPIPETWGCGDYSTNRVFEYDPKLDRWTEKASMNEKRSQLGTAVIGDKMYAFGGISSEDDNNELYQYTLSGIEEYDLITNAWKEKKSLPMSVSGLGTVNVDNKIYLIGGQKEANIHDTTNILNSVFTYEPQTELIKQLPSMNKARNNLVTICNDDKIYALGGDESNSVEEFKLIKKSNDPKNGKVEYEYDNKKSQLLYILKNGNRYIKFNYDSNGNLIGQEVLDN